MPTAIAAPKLSDSQADFIDDCITDSIKRVTILDGAMSSGKTFCSLIGWALWVAARPLNERFLMAGKTVRALDHNCLELLREMCPKSFDGSISRKEGTLMGHKVHFEGAYDKRSEDKIRGDTLGGVYLDEATILDKEFFWMAYSRIRTPGAKMIGTTNPDAPNHWLMAEVFENPEIQLYRRTFSIFDNHFLDPEYVAGLIAGYTGFRYDRYILGRWVRAEGAIYPLFIDNEQEFYINISAKGTVSIDGKMMPITNINIGVDWGARLSGHAFVATGWTPGFEHMVVLASEWHNADGTDADWVCSAAAAFASGVAAAYGRVYGIYADSAEQTLINTLRKKTYMPVYNSIKRPVIDRIRHTDLLMVQRRIYLTRDCASLAKALREAVYDDKKLVDTRLDTAGGSDIDSLDAFEYSWEYYL